MNTTPISKGNSPVFHIERNIRDVLPGKSVTFDSYFLASRTLNTSQASGLLVSTSFGANSILYATWLGYAMGLWALLIHAAWCLSFILLSRYASKIYRYTSLHDFLGYKFGRVTQIAASVCSIIGLLYFAGWEIMIAKTGIQSIAEGSGLALSGSMPYIISSVIFAAIFYTTMGGMRANGHLDKVLNVIKICLFAFAVFAIGRIVIAQSTAKYFVFFPSMSSAIGGIGVAGFFTNLILNISWQFVDNTSWQTISTGNKRDSKIAKKILIRASGKIFLVYILGTFLGTILRVIPNLNSDNILGTIASSDMVNSNVIFCLIVLLLLSMISLIDGVGLSVAQTFLCDLRVGGMFKKFSDNVIARVLTIAFGAFAVWGVQMVLNIAGKTVFDFVYVFIVAQLSLLGSAICGLISKKETMSHMWVSILVGLISGICSITIGELFKQSAFYEAAGAVSAVSSLLAAFIMSRDFLQNKNTSFI